MGCSALLRSQCRMILFWRPWFMNDTAKEKEPVKQIGIQQLVSALFRKSWIVILSSILCAVLTLLGTYYLITPKYQSSAMFYVNNNSLTLNGGSISIDSGDLSAAKELVDSYIVILESRESLMDIIDYASVDRTYMELAGMISAESVNSTEIFKVVVTSPDPYEAERIAEAITELLPKRIGSIIEGTSAKVVDSPIVATSPSSPSYIKNVILGFLIGFILSAGMIVLHTIFDVTIRSEEDVQLASQRPVLAAVPDMMNQKSGSGYYYKDAQKRVAGAVIGEKESVLIGSGISFAASEAYKLLRTKLQFSFVDENDCHIIGVSSALAGEGKSISSVNLAYSMAQLNKRVLLVDCDMRRPSLNAKLPIQKIPGLSN